MICPFKTDEKNSNNQKQCVSDCALYTNGMCIFMDIGKNINKIMMKLTNDIQYIDKYNEKNK